MHWGIIQYLVHAKSQIPKDLNEKIPMREKRKKKLLSFGFCAISKWGDLMQWLKDETNNRERVDALWGFGNKAQVEDLIWLKRVTEIKGPYFKIGDNYEKLQVRRTEGEMIKKYETPPGSWLLAGLTRPRVANLGDLDHSWWAGQIWGCKCQCPVMTLGWNIPQKLLTLSLGSLHWKPSSFSSCTASRYLDDTSVHVQQCFSEQVQIQKKKREQKEEEGWHWEGEN